MLLWAFLAGQRPGHPFPRHSRRGLTLSPCESRPRRRFGFPLVEAGSCGSVFSPRDSAFPLFGEGLASSGPAEGARACDSKPRSHWTRK